ncbi:MAG: hypothetical protein KBG82_07100 [Spirochaetes bacterium]|nr:hypothetical protein [Spirochaetota bacterium]
MAATELTSTLITTSGVAYSLASANADGNYFKNNGYTFFVVSNGGSSAITVTIDSKATCNFGGDHDIEVSVGEGATKIIGPFNVARFNDAEGEVNVSYSDVTSVTVGVWRLY